MKIEMLTCKELDNRLKVLIEKGETDWYSKDEKKRAKEEKEYSDEWINVFETLYRKSHNENYYWEFCTFETFRNHYEKNKENFLANNLDATEADYCKFLISSFSESKAKSDDIIEILAGYCVKYPLENWREIMDSILFKVDNAIEKKLSFLQSRIKFNDPLFSDFKGISQSEVLQEPMENLSVKKAIIWDGSDVELAELIIALHASGRIGDISKKEAFRIIGDFFSVDLDETIATQSLSKRIDNGGEISKFLTHLTNKLDNWNSKREERKNRMNK